MSTPFLASVPVDDASLIEAVLRKTQDLSQTAAAAAIGVSQKSLSRWRAGERNALWEETRRKLEEFLRRGGTVEETPEEAVAANMPDVSFLKPRARAIYDRAVGSYLTRNWPQPIIERAAWDLVNYIIGANTLRSKGPGMPELTEEEQVWVLEDSMEHIERAYGPNGALRRF